jgi:hypothetical protein
MTVPTTSSVECVVVCATVYFLLLHKDNERWLNYDTTSFPICRRYLCSELIMHYSGRTFLSTLTFASLQPFTLGTWIPSHNHQQKNGEFYDGGSVQVMLPDFGDLAKYVCPNKHSNIFNRQSAGMSTVSMAQIHEILDLLAAYEQSTLTMVNKIVVADGVDPASAVPSILPAATTQSSLISAAGSVSPPALDQRPPYLNCPSPSLLTTTLTETATVTADPTTTTETITISAAAPSIQPTTNLVTAQVLTSAAPSAAATSLPPAQPSTPPYTFNATSPSNIAVYFGQTPATASTSLEAQCADPNTDIVILAFVIGQLDGGPYPSINFGAACSGQTPLMAAKAPGLLSCPELAGNITACQRGWGKKVLLSIGGGEGSNIKFASEKAAKSFAGMLWGLFGPTGGVDEGLRPFGGVEVDGFDIGLFLPFFFPFTPLSLFLLYEMPVWVLG